jgi:hypothetical protein
MSFGVIKKRRMRWKGHVTTYIWKKQEINIKIYHWKTPREETIWETQAQKTILTKTSDTRVSRSKPDRITSE